ncbi:MAG: LysR family transcriptional regulator [Acidobacteriales bacterium]|nr:LysR family transcriptional regulator [Terriglobales bacterium]
MDPVLDMRHLRVVAAVADEGGVTKASKRLHLTQSALSHQLRDAEQKLGAQLFLRIRKRMVPTPAGEKLLQSARRVLQELGHTEADIRQISGGTAGVIRLATECYTCYHWLASVAGRFQHKFPKVELRISAEDTLRPVAALLEGRLDVAILSSDPGEGRVELELLFEDELVLLLSPQHRLAKARAISVADLAGETVLIYPPREESFLLNRFLLPAGVQPRSVLQVPLTEAILEMVTANLGITLMARWAAAGYLKDKKLVSRRIGNGGFPRRWYAAMVREPSPPVYVREFIKLLQAPNMPFRYSKNGANGSA